MHTHLSRGCWGVLERILPHFPALCPSSDITFWSLVEPGCWAVQTAGLTRFSLFYHTSPTKVVGRRGQRWRRLSFGRKSSEKISSQAHGVMELPPEICHTLEAGFQQGLVWFAFACEGFEGWAMGMSRTGTCLKVLLLSQVGTFSSEWFHRLWGQGGRDIDPLSIVCKEPMLPTK